MRLFTQPGPDLESWAWMLSDKAVDTTDYYGIQGLVSFCTNTHIMRELVERSMIPFLFSAFYAL
jgi:hypothetical protein